ncbi:MAG: hypothetical protein WBF05_12470, partial [Anaerolineales bacterium]
MIELVHDQRQIHILHSSMISPGLPQAMCTKVTSQAHLLANGCYEFPSLTTPDGSGLIIGLRVEKPEVVWITGNIRMKYVHQEHGIKFDLEIQVPKHQSFCRLVDIRKVTLSKNPPSKLPQLTHTQINYLAVVHGLTKTQVIIVAVDRLARDLNAESL